MSIFCEGGYSYALVFGISSHMRLKSMPTAEEIVRKILEMWDSAGYVNQCSFVDGCHDTSIEFVNDKERKLKTIMRKYDQKIDHYLNLRGHNSLAINFPCVRDLYRLLQNTCIDYAKLLVRHFIKKKQILSPP
jgi:hypothetical protein